MTLNLPLTIETWKRVRDQLLADFPELADDPETLNDTLEGVTGARDAVWRLVKKAREDEAAVEALVSLIASYTDRKARYDRRATAAREAALRMMQAIGDAKIERPEATISRSRGRPRVIIPDESAVPETFCVVKRTPNRSLIGSLLRDNTNPPNWATLSEPEDVLTVRVR